MFGQPPTTRPNNPIDAWHQSEGRLRILLVISAPLDEPARLNPSREVEEIYRQLDYAKIPAALIKLNPPTWQHLRATLLHCQFDVVHFIGHATKDNIQLEKEDGTLDWISTDHLAELFEYANVKLVVLNNCSSESLGDSLISQRVPAIISTSNRIHNDVSVHLVSSLYSTIFNGRSPTDAAKLINQSMHKSTASGKIVTVVASGPKANTPISTPSPGIGSPTFFHCSPVNNLPPLSRNVFYDRVDECLQVYDRLTHGDAFSPYVGVTGITGSGKSAVALSCAWRYSWRFSKGIAYVSLRQKPFNLLASLGHFNWTFDDISIDKVPVAILYELSQGPYLLVFDDVEAATPEEVYHIVEILQAWDTSLGGRAILVMRQRRMEFDSLVQANWIPIGNLPHDAAIELFQSYLGGRDVARSKLGNDLSNVPTLCYHHPKLIQATASALISGTPWNEIITNLRHLTGDPVKRSIEMLETTINQIQNDVPVVIHFLDSWSAFAESATEPAWRFIVAGKRLDHSDPMRGFQDDALSMMQRVNILERFEVSGEIQCRVHPLVSEYLHVRRWQTLTAEKRKQYEELHLQYYIDAISTDKADMYPIISEWGNIALALDRAEKAGNLIGMLTLCEELVANDNHLLMKRGPWEYTIKALNIGISAATEAGDLRGKAKFLKNLGIVHYRLAEYGQAQNAYEQSLNIAESIGYSDLEVDALRGKGQVYYRTGDYELAKEAYLSGLSIAESKGDIKRIADVKHQLGKAAFRQGDTKQAGEIFGSVLETRKDIGDRFGVSKTLHEIARVMHAAKQYSEAASLYHESLAVRREVNDRVGQQATLHQLGVLAFDQGDYELARKYYDESMTLAEALGDRVWMAHNLFRQGQLSWRLGNTENAINLVSKSRDLCDILGIGFKAKVEKWLEAPN